MIISKASMPNNVLLSSINVVYGSQNIQSLHSIHISKSAASRLGYWMGVPQQGPGAQIQKLP